MNITFTTMVMLMRYDYSKPIKQASIADQKQIELHKKFPSSHFLRSQKNCDNFLRWNTFFRRNFHRFAIDYLGIKLYEYQALTLYEMGVNNMIVIVASRAAAKSFLIALYACIRCILYPNTKILLASATLGQSKLIITEKIEAELMNMSPTLPREIASIKNNNNTSVVQFKNMSKIIVVPAGESCRGHRSNNIVREEFRQIKQNVDESILSPCQILRNAPYMLDPFYANMPELKEEPVDIYISSSWFDNGNWMWHIVDNAYNQMVEGKKSVLLAYDESVILKHNIKSMKQLVSEKRKQDPITWRLEFLNERVKENTSAFFTFRMFQNNQRLKQVFYPRTLIDFKSGRKNPYNINKQKGEVRLISCDLAFVDRDGNDNSAFSCMRLLPESKTHNSDDGDVIVDNGYRRQVPYIEKYRGGEIKKQAIRIAQLFYDFQADYIVIDLRSAGIAVYDQLARPLYDQERGIEYPALTCMNDANLKNRIKVDGAEEKIFAIVASQKLNSDIAVDFRNVLDAGKIDFLINLSEAQEEILCNIKEYNETPDADEQIFYENPFLQTQALISESTGLVCERKADTGMIVVKEQGRNTKDVYTSVSYASYFASLLERDLLSENEEYEYGVFIN